MLVTTGAYVIKTKSRKNNMLHWLHNCMTTYEDVAVPPPKQNVTTAGAEPGFFLGGRCTTKKWCN